MKKLISVIIAIILLGTNMCTVCAAMPEENINLITNGSFETESTVGSTEIYGWTQTKIGSLYELRTRDRNYLIPADDGGQFVIYSGGGAVLRQTVMLDASADYVVNQDKYTFVLSFSGYAAGWQPKGIVTVTAHTKEGRSLPSSYSGGAHFTAKNTWTMNDASLNLAELLNVLGDTAVKFDIELKSTAGEMAWDGVKLTPEYVGSRVKRENILQNGSFEILNEDGKPNGWDAVDAWNGSYTSLAEGDGEMCIGRYAAKIVSKDYSRPRIGRNATVSGNNTYKLSFWYKGSTYNLGFRIDMEEYKGDRGSDYLGVQSSPLYTTADNWTYVEHIFYTNPNTKRVYVMPRVTSTGATIYLDDISLEFIKNGPEQFKMETDWVFYYQEYTEATVTLSMDDWYEDTGYTVELGLADGEQTVFAKENLAFTDNKLEYKIDITGLEKKKAYALCAIVRDNRGAIVQTLTQNIYRFDRPTRIDKDGVYRVNGEPFDHVTAYHMYDPADYETALSGGINVIGWYPYRSVETLLSELDYIDSLGMKVSVSLGRFMLPAGHPKNAEWAAGIVAAVKDHPAVFGYSVMDEPFSHNAFADKDLEESYRIIRSIDDVHPVYLCADHSYRRSSKYVDILEIDPYPGNGFDFATHVVVKTAEAVAGTLGERPVYTTIQAFSWADGTPTTQQVRTQLFQSFMAGAQGLGYYTWEPHDENVDDYLHKGRYWDMITEFAQAEQSLLFELYNRGENRRFNSYRDDRLWYDNFIYQNHIYTVVLNPTSEDEIAQISLAGPGGEAVTENYEIEVISSGNTEGVTKQNGRFTVSLTGYQAVIYKITPSDSNIMMYKTEKDIKVYASGLAAGDRLYLALYEEKGDTEQLVDVEIYAADGNGFAFCTIDNKSRLLAKAFVWSAGMGTKLLKKS
ncbi:MAG: hypothetical protein IKV89_05865 [Clostridia bacterium]|nr:hypothetical protein [Clostridia bacterium]